MYYIKFFNYFISYLGFIRYSKGNAHFDRRGNARIERQGGRVSF